MKPFVKIITNNSFQSFTIFPVVKAKKQFGEYGPWIIEVAILKEFLFYSYRFFLPTYFLTYQKDFELEIKLQFIQSYSRKSLQKTFYSHQILGQYKNNNNKISKILEVLYIVLILILLIILIIIILINNKVIIITLKNHSKYLSNLFLK